MSVRDDEHDWMVVDRGHTSIDRQPTTMYQCRRCLILHNTVSQHTPPFDHIVGRPQGIFATCEEEMEARRENWDHPRREQAMRARRYFRVWAA